MISKAELDFLSELEKNNNRDWFNENKKHFEIMPREPMTLDAYTEALAKIVAN